MSSKRASPPVRVDAQRWSRSSRQSLEYLNPPRTYRDIRYKCWRCNSPDVFTAEQQKTAFEVKQAYIWQRRILCQTCFRERRRLEKLAREWSRLWRDRKTRLARNRTFLQEWLGTLEELPKYAARRNSANIAMLRKRLAMLA